jgi:hypothetical protein
MSDFAHVDADDFQSLALDMVSGDVPLLVDVGDGLRAVTGVNQLADNYGSLLLKLDDEPWPLEGLRSNEQNVLIEPHRKDD